MSHLDEGTLTALFDGELAREQRQLAEQHLADCGECRRLYEEIHAFAGEADQLVARVQPAVAPRHAMPRPGGRPAWERFRPLAWAATLVLAAGLGWSASVRRFAPSQSPSTEQPTATVPSLSSIPEEKVLTEPAAGARERADAPQDEAARRQVTQPPTPAVGGAAKTALTATPAEADQPAANQAGRAESAAGAAPAAGLAAAPRQARAAEVSARDAAAPATGRREASLEEAVRILGGTVKLIDGLQPQRVQVGPERGPDGPAAETVRIIYLDPPGRELWLDQQRNPAATEDRAATPSAPGLLAGDTVVTAAGTGLTRVRWMSQDGFRLTLTGHLPGDSLRSLVQRVH